MSNKIDVKLELIEETDSKQCRLFLNGLPIVIIVDSEGEKDEVLVQSINLEDNLGWGFSKISNTYLDTFTAKATQVRDTLDITVFSYDGETGSNQNVLTYLVRPQTIYNETETGSYSVVGMTYDDRQRWTTLFQSETTGELTRIIDNILKKEVV